MQFMMLLLPVVYLLGNGYVFWRLWPLLAGVPLWLKIVCSVAFWVVALMLVITILMRDVALPQWLSRAMFSIGSMWMAFLLIIRWML